MKPLICVVGPTACGKTRMGVLLAQRYYGEVVSCDSMQIYRGMRIGTAAPTPEETEGVPHHMIGVIDPSEPYSVARYAKDAGRCVDDILARGRQPVVVGGTGLYLDALLAGHGFAAGRFGGKIRRELEARCDTEGLDTLLAELQSADPERAAQLDPNDRKRILRALEVYRETGKPITQHEQEARALPPRYRAIYLGFAFANREDMKERIDRRVDEMVLHGLFDEVRALLDMGVPRTSTAFQAIGYKESLTFLDGRTTRDETVSLIKLRSRQYAKRQLTWLRRNPAIHWYYWKETQNFQDALDDSTEILSRCGVF